MEWAAVDLTFPWGAAEQASRQNTKAPRSDEWRDIFRRMIKEAWIRSQAADAGRSGPSRTLREDQEERRYADGAISNVSC